MGVWEPLPRPAYLDAKSPRGAIIAYHAQQADHLRETLKGLRDTAIEMARQSGMIVDQKWLDDYDARQAELKWDDASVGAVFRDRLKFHEQSLEFLTHG